MKPGETAEKGAEIFKRFLHFFGIEGKDVQKEQKYWKVDIDVLTKLKKYEIKANYHSDRFAGNTKSNFITIEDHKKDSATEKRFPGWFESSKADFFVFVDATAEDMVVVKNNKEFRDWYTGLRDRYSFNCYWKPGDESHGGLFKYTSYLCEVPLVAIPKELFVIVKCA